MSADTVGRRTDAVLFDLDGTLVDSPTGIAQILGKMYPDAEPDRISHAIGRPLTAVLADLAGRSLDDPAVEQAAEEFRRRFTEEVVPHAADLVFPGVRVLLAELNRRGVRTGVVTSKSPRGAAELLAATALELRFDRVVGFTAVRRGKPAPDQALEAAQLLSTQPRACLVVGDSTDDILMARAAGMRSLGVGFGVHTTQALQAAGADSVVGSPEEMAAVVLQITNKEFVNT